MEPTLAAAVAIARPGFSTLFTGQVNGTEAPCRLASVRCRRFQYPLHGSSKWNLDDAALYAVRRQLFQYPLHGSSKWNAASGRVGVGNQESFSTLFTGQVNGTRCRPPRRTRWSRFSTLFTGQVNGTRIQYFNASGTYQVSVPSSRVK